MVKNFSVVYSPTVKNRFRYKVKLNADDDDIMSIIKQIGPICGTPFKSLDRNFDKAFYVYGNTTEVKDQILNAINSVIEEEKTKQIPSSPPEAEATPPKEEKILKKSEQEVSSSPQPPSSPALKDILSELLITLTLNPRYRFETLYEGDFNRWLKKICEKIAKKFDISYDPLFIWGGVGLGKTHLIQAIGNYVMENHPDKKVIYIQAQDLINAINKIKDNPEKRERFVNAFKDVDYLLVDDFQFLEKDESSQDIFFLIFEKLYQQNKQIVITADRPPNQLMQITDRLRSRFTWGLVSKLSKPDLASREGIIKLKIKSEFHPLKLSKEMINYIAGEFQDNIREIEGVLKKIRAYVELRNEPVSMEMLNAVINELKGEEATILTEEKKHEKKPVEQKPTSPPTQPTPPPQPSVAPEQKVTIPPPPDDMPPPPPEVQCPYCGGELSYIEAYDRWYCYNCKRYAPPDFGKGKYRAVVKKTKVDKKEVEKKLAVLEELKKIGEKPEASPQKEPIKPKEFKPPYELKFARVIPYAIFYPANYESAANELPNRILDVIYKHRLHIKFEATAFLEYNPQNPNFTSFVKSLNDLKLKVGIVIGPKNMKAEEEDKFYSTLSRMFEDSKLCLEYLEFEEINKDFAILNIVLDVANYGKQKLGYSLLKEEFRGSNIKKG